MCSKMTVKRVYLLTIQSYGYHITGMGRSNTLMVKGKFMHNSASNRAMSPLRHGFYNTFRVGLGRPGAHRQLRSNSTSTSARRWTARRIFHTTVLLMGGGLSGLFSGILARAWYCSRLYDREDDFLKHQASELEVAAYRKLPLRMLSRAWGWMCERHLPELLRSPLLGLYSWFFSCNLDEAENSDLRSYVNLSDFFRRSLKDGARPVDTASPLVSPSDGKVLHVGRVDSGRVEQVKGVTYPLNVFLGSSQDPEVLKNSLLECKDTDLYHITIYLAPGDYHRFHSATDWTCFARKHFSGYLLSVSPLIARFFPNLFCINERVVYSGKWRHGFFSYVPVGATNVGSIRVYIDHDLRTNQKSTPIESQYHKTFGDSSSGLTVQKGDMFGEFNLGSTIVLIFEAPKDFEFSVKPGSTVKCGQSLCTL